MRRAIVLGAFGASLIVGAACGADATSPTATNSAPVVTAPAPPPQNFPAPAGEARNFVFAHELSYPVSEYTKNSRFVLYANGAFALRFESISGEYRGKYTESNGVIVFDWEGWSTAGPWGATGTLKGDTLTVQYNLIMSLTDFEDAVYVVSQ